MLFTLWLAWLLQTPPPAPAPQSQAPPDTEIFVATLSGAGASLTVTDPVNVTNSKGYDNQPSFLPDGSGMLFTSVRGDGKSSDIYRYDFAARAIVRVTETPESEYPPTVTPDGQHISVIRVEADNTQRLWRFTLDGKQPELVLTEIKPVGYHAWTGEHALALFVLGQPATLQLADARSGKAETVATGIGRSVLQVPGRGTVSFVTSERAAAEGAPPTMAIQELDPKTKAITPLVKPVAGARQADLAWTPDGRLLMAHEGRLYMWRRGEAEWKVAADLTALGLRGVSRMAVNAAGDRIAFVTQ